MCGAVLLLTVTCVWYSTATDCHLCVVQHCYWLSHVCGTALLLTVTCVWWQHCYWLSLVCGTALLLAVICVWYSTACYWLSHVCGTVLLLTVTCVWYSTATDCHLCVALLLTLVCGWFGKLLLLECEGFVSSVTVAVSNNILWSLYFKITCRRWSNQHVLKVLCSMRTCY